MTPPLAAITHAYRETHERILTLADALLPAGLVDELHLRIVPVLLGDGRSFTPADVGDRRLELDRVAPRPGGVVSLRYAVS